MKNQNNKNNATFVPTNPRAFFAKAIALQKRAFKIDFAEQKLEQSCTALLNAGFCSGCRSCDVCALQRAHEETRVLLSIPSVQKERYKAWKCYQREYNSRNGW